MMEIKTIHIDEEVHNELKEYCNEKHIIMKKIIEEMIETKLNERINEHGKIR